MNGTEHYPTQEYEWVSTEKYDILRGWGAGVILPLLGSSSLTLEEWNQPFLRFLPLAYTHMHIDTKYQYIISM